MTTVSHLRNSELGLPRFLPGLFRDDRLYRYLKVYPIKNLCEGSHIHSNRRAEHIPPVHRLPVELLAEIFRHYLQIVDYSQPPLSLCIKPYSQTTPFRLGQVCCYWRSIAFSVADLWRSMFIGTPRLEHIPLVRLWLRHAGELPLSLWLFQSQRPDDQELQATNAILSLLVERLHRWRTINFRFSTVVHQALLMLPHGSAVSLESARIDVRDWDQKSADILWRSLHSSPSLRRPDWVNRYRYGPPSHAPWAQLTHITLEGLLPVNVVLDVLGYCQNVVELTLPYLHPSNTSFQAPPFMLVWNSCVIMRVFYLKGSQYSIPRVSSSSPVPHLTPFTASVLYDV